MGFIYILTSPSGKSYIGQTNRPIEERFKEHQKSNSNSFASGGEAAQAFGKTDGSSISRCARGEQNTAYGFKWSYAPPLPHLFSA